MSGLVLKIELIGFSDSLDRESTIESRMKKREKEVKNDSKDFWPGQLGEWRNHSLGWSCFKE